MRFWSHKPTLPRLSWRRLMALVLRWRRGRGHESTVSERSITITGRSRSRHRRPTGISRSRSPTFAQTRPQRTHSSTTRHAAHLTGKNAHSRHFERAPASSSRPRPLSHRFSADRPSGQMASRHSPGSRSPPSRSSALQHSACSGPTTTGSLRRSRTRSSARTSNATTRSTFRSTRSTAISRCTWRTATAPMSADAYVRCVGPSERPSSL